MANPRKVSEVAPVLDGVCEYFRAPRPNHHSSITATECIPITPGLRAATVLVVELCAREDEFTHAFPSATWQRVASPLVRSRTASTAGAFAIEVGTHASFR